MNKDAEHEVKKGKCHSGILITLLSLLLAVPSAGAHAQTVPTQSYSSMHWRLVGPFRAGRSIAAAGVPGNPYVFYFGGVDGGMWKTENAGVTCFHNQAGLATLGASRGSWSR